jgi:3-phytase
MLKTSLSVFVTMLLCGGCTTRQGAEAAPAAAPLAATVASVPVRGETAGSLQDDGNDVAIWRHPSDPARSVLLASGGTAGLEIFALDGRRLGRVEDVEIDFVTVSDDFPFLGKALPLVVAYDRRSRGLLAFTIDPDSLVATQVTAATLGTAGEVTGLCTYRSPVTGDHYAFASTEGQVEQWKLYGVDREVRGQLVRSVPVGVGAGYCAVDPIGQSLYVSEETVGIWKLKAEPETEAERTAVDLVEPYGRIAGEVKSLAVYRIDDATGYLLASDVGGGKFNVYSLDDGRHVGSFRVDAAGAVDAVGEAEGIAVTPATLASGTEGGLLAIFDEDNEGEPANLKLVAWQDVAKALQLRSAPAGSPSPPPAPSSRTVVAAVETQPVDDFGDAADDPAIWIHPTRPELSLVIGTNKKRGLEVYDLAGRRIQSLPDGRMNNVDLRDGFRIGSESVTLVAASNRTTKSIALYRIDPVTRRLEPVADGTIATGLSDPYGLCMYRSAQSGETYVFVNDSADGAFRQWRLVAKDGRVGVELVRSFGAGSQSEGCVADDETGALYVGEEDVGLWRYSAEPTGGNERRLVDSTTAPGRLAADVEGIGLVSGADGRGYLVVSNQGADNYAVYRREGNNELVGFFDVVANDALGIDGVSETDGLAVTGSSLGTAFPHGLLVVQDGRNITPAERQNFKFVPWQDVIRALELD